MLRTFVGLCLFIFTLSLTAEELTVYPEETAVIQNADATVSRILIHFPALDTSYVNLIDSIIVAIPINGSSQVGPDSTLLMSLVETEWTANTVSWTSPWNRAGGDIQDYFTDGRVIANTDSIRMNVTALFTAIYQGLSDDHGFELHLRRETGENPLALEDPGQIHLTIFYSENQ